jgi:isocitrate dehydrogenase
MEPKSLKVSQLRTGSGNIKINEYQRPQTEKTLVGIDVFIDWQGSDPQEIGNALAKHNAGNLKLKMITNRGVKVYPEGLKETYCTDHWRCRYVSVETDTKISPPDYKTISTDRLLLLLAKLNQEGFDVIKTENLYEFDGKRGFSLGQGE